ncbi:holo-ACP synthase [Paenibacillus sp. YYML68]|uniref:holo-ACP synthase n=1 Tax=Paenibacillus sp. YYML68 TaxID=2909250 RepID=UPI0024915D4A|nr:holo-ACP synthase [Paenibacillus sp. YYML68]
MIVGIGTDLLEIERVRRILSEASGARFLERVLTPAERELAQGRAGRLAEFTAGRFAAKEAVAKAFGCGIGKQLSLQDIEVLPSRAGKPECRISARSKERLYPLLGLPVPQDAAVQGRKDTLVIHLSITHSDTAAMAYCIIERVDGTRHS